MSKSLKTVIRKEIEATANYGFGKNRGLAVKAFITDGDLKRVEIIRHPTENTSGQTVTLETDALELLRLLAPVMNEFLEEVEKEVGNVR